MLAAVVAAVALIVIALGRTASPWTADSAPAAKVAPDHWTTGDKEAIGTAYSRQSNVWFTATHGTLADVLYPTIDVDNLRQLGFLVTDGSSFLFDSASEGIASSKVGDDRALIYDMQVASASFVIATQIRTDPDRPVVVVSASMPIASSTNLKVYAYLVPHLGGTGAFQTAFFDGSRAYVHSKLARSLFDAEVWLAIGGDMVITDSTAGYLGHGDG